MSKCCGQGWVGANTNCPLLTGQDPCVTFPQVEQTPSFSFGLYSLLHQMQQTCLVTMFSVCLSLLSYNWMNLLIEMTALLSSLFVNYWKTADEQLWSEASLENPQWDLKSLKGGPKLPASLQATSQGQNKTNKKIQKAKPTNQKNHKPSSSWKERNYFLAPPRGKTDEYCFPTTHH